MTLENIPDDQLQAELTRRNNEKARKAEEAKSERAEFLLENIDGLLPLMTHQRTSCSDADPNNSSSFGRVRCAKCQVLMFKRDSWWDPDFKISVEGHY